MPFAKNNFFTRNPQKTFQQKTSTPITKDLYARNIYAFIGTWPTHDRDMARTWQRHDWYMQKRDREVIFAPLGHDRDLTRTRLRHGPNVNELDYGTRRKTWPGYHSDMIWTCRGIRHMTVTWPKRDHNTKSRPEETGDMTRECPQTWQIHDHDRDITGTRMGQDGLGICPLNARWAALSMQNRKLVAIGE